MNDEKCMKFDTQDSIGILTLTRPQKLNAISGDFLSQMSDIERQIVDMTSEGLLKVIVILSEGKHFCAGIDLDFLDQAGSKWALNSVHYTQNILGFWHSVNVPVIVGIQGVCMGAGMELALAADIRVAAENVRFSIPEVKYGLAPDLGGSTRLTKLIGPGRAKYIALTCDEVKGKDAFDFGIVEKVVPLEELNNEVFALAKKIASKPVLSSQLAKKCINLAAESSYASSLIAEEIQCIACLDTYDKKEAVAAFKEKREAVFKGL